MASPDYSNLSDEELHHLAELKVQKQSDPARYDQLSDEELSHLADKKAEVSGGFSSKLLNNIVARTGTGIAVGVAEAANQLLNPATWPGAAERLGRAGYNYATTDEGLIQSFSRADKEAVVPSLRIQEELAPGLRAGVRYFGNHREIPIADLYKEEQAGQALADKEYFVGNQVAELGVGLASLASLAKGATKAVGAAGAVKKAASQAAFDSLKPLAKQAERINAQGRAVEIGDQLLKDKIMNTVLGVGPSFKKIQDRIATKLKEYGSQIDHFVTTADKARDADSSIRGVNVEALANDVKQNLITPLQNDPNTVNIAKQVEDWLDNVRSISQNQDVSFAQAQKWKMALGKTKAKFKAGADDLSSEAFDDLYRIVNEHVETGVQSAIQTAAPEIENGFVAAKNSYRNLKDAETAIKRTLARGSQNKKFGLTDVISGNAGGVTGGVAMAVQSGGDPMKTLLGYLAGQGAGLANKAIRSRGTQTYAAGLNALTGPVSNMKSVGSAAALLNLLTGSRENNGLQEAAKQKLRGADGK